MPNSQKKKKKNCNMFSKGSLEWVLSGRLTYRKDLGERRGPVGGGEVTLTHKFYHIINNLTLRGLTVFFIWAQEWLKGEYQTELLDLI